MRLAHSLALLAALVAAPALALDPPRLAPQRLGPVQGDVVLQGGAVTTTGPVQAGSVTATGVVTAPSLLMTGSGLAGPVDGGTIGGTAVSAILGSKAPLASPVFSGTVTAPAVSVSGAANVGSLTTPGAVTAGSVTGDGAGVSVAPSSGAAVGRLDRSIFEALRGSTF